MLSIVSRSSRWSVFHFFEFLYDAKFLKVVRSTLLRLPLMGPLRAIPGGPPASMAWTPLTQGSPHQINGFQKKLGWDPPHFVCRLRFFKRFFQGWTADTGPRPHLGSFWGDFLKNHMKTCQIDPRWFKINKIAIMNQAEIICDAFFKISNFMIFGVFWPLLASKMLIFSSVAALPRNAIRITHMAVSYTHLTLPTNREV